jgi:hypothetical protein
VDFIALLQLIQEWAFFVVMEIVKNKYNYNDVFLYNRPLSAGEIEDIMKDSCLE